MTTRIIILFGVMILAVATLFIVLFTVADHDGQEQYTDEPRPQSPGNEEIPEYVHTLLAEPQKRPLPNQLVELQEKDLPTLLRLIEAASDLSQRRALVWGVAYLGGERVAGRLVQALTSEFKNETLSQEEEDTLCDTVLALGCVAKGDDAAYTFLKGASNTAFWDKTRLWESPRGDYANNLLTSYSIQAVAISGRQDAMSFLESLKAQSRKYLHAFAGDIAQGVFYLHLRQKGGQRLLMEYMLTPNNKILFEEWIRTNEGAYWLAWVNDQMRGPVPRE